MNYEDIEHSFLQEHNVDRSTMMGTPCLRYKDEFIAMMFEKEDALIIKTSPERVLQIIESGAGMEFNFTKKRFKQWVMIPLEFMDQYEGYLMEALRYAQKKPS